MNSFFYFLLGLWLVPSKVFAAACCGGTANVPSLITGDDRAQITATISNGTVVADATVQGGLNFRSPSDDETSQTLRFDAATLLTDRLQLGATIPVNRRMRKRSINNVESSGLSDVSVSLGYEAVPNWDYHPIRPKVLAFVATTFPTGNSLYEAKELYRVDVRGRGFYSFSIGALLSKEWGNWDSSLLVEIHRPLNRTIQTDLGPLKVLPGWGTSGSVSIGWSPMNGDFRLGTNIVPSLEAPVSTEGVTSGTGERTLLWTLGFQASYMLADEISMSLIFSDQTLIRGSENSGLSRMVSFLVQKRWGR